MTLWVFNLSTDPTGEFSQARAIYLTVAAAQRARDVARGLTAADRLRQDALKRGDPVIVIWNIDIKKLIDLLQNFGVWEEHGNTWSEGTYVSNIGERLDMVLNMTDYRIIDARTLSVEDGKVVASAQPS